MESNQTCDRCRFFSKDQTADNWGTCHFYPPCQNVGGQKRWPACNVTDFCGKWEPSFN